MTPQRIGPLIRSRNSSLPKPKILSFAASSGSGTGSKDRYSAENWYDVWYPNLAPLPETIKLVAADAKLGTVSPRQWATFEKRYRAEMAKPEPSRTLDLFAALSHTADFSVGCYCAEESRCHRSILRKLLIERQAKLG